MTHFTTEQWKKYVRNELDEEVRQVYDDHLYNCDQCLELYLQAMDEVEDSLPVITDGQHFTDQIMAQISSEKQLMVKKSPFYQKTGFQYVIAAAMTVLLMSSGVFQSIVNIIDVVNEPVAQVETPSLTEGLMNKAFALMDSIDISKKEVNE